MWHETILQKQWNAAVSKGLMTDGVKALHSSFSQHGICEWLDDKMVAFTTDGALVLLSGLSAEVQKKHWVRCCFTAHHIGHKGLILM